MGRSYLASVSILVFMTFFLLDAFVGSPVALAQDSPDPLRAKLQARQNQSAGKSQQEQAQQAFLNALRAQQSRKNSQQLQSQSPSKKLSPQKVEELLIEYLKALQAERAKQEAMARNKLTARPTVMPPNPREFADGTQLLGTVPVPSEPFRKTPQLVRLRLHLAKVKSFDGSTLAKLRADLKKSSFDRFRETVHSLGTQLEFEFENELMFTAINGKSSELLLGEQTPVKTGATVTRGGQKVFNYNQMETGMGLSLLPKIEDGLVQIELEIKKSFLSSLESDDDSFSPTKVETFQCETTAVIKNGTIELISLSDDKNLWLLTVSAQTID